MNGKNIRTGVLAAAAAIGAYLFAVFGYGLMQVAILASVALVVVGCVVLGIYWLVCDAFGCRPFWSRAEKQ